MQCLSGLVWKQVNYNSLLLLVGCVELWAAYPLSDISELWCHDIQVHVKCDFLNSQNLVVHIVSPCAGHLNCKAWVYI